MSWRDRLREATTRWEQGPGSPERVDEMERAAKVAGAMLGTTATGVRLRLAEARRAGMSVRQAVEVLR